MLSAVHTLMQNSEFAKREWKAKTALASAVLAFSQRTSSALLIKNTTDIKYQENTKDPLFETVRAEAKYPLKETAVAHEMITSVTEAKTEAEMEANTDVELEANTEAETEANTDAEAGANAGAEAEADTEANIKTKTYTIKTEADTEAKTEAKTEAERETQTEASIEAKTGAKTKADTKADMEAKMEAKTEVETAANMEPEAEATMEAKMEVNVDANADLKTEANAWAWMGDIINSEVESCAPRLVYYRLMVPNWLRQNATWSCDYEGDDLDLDIKSDASNWENIFRIQISSASQFIDCADITVNMKIGVLLSEQAPALDSNMSYMISDGHFAIGFQLNDPQQDYATRGPYQALEGEVGSRSLRNPNTKVAATVNTTNTKKPNQFELRFKPSEAWGSAYCALDEGHKIVAQYSTPLRLSKGLRFEVYRHNSKERYRINYVEFFVYHDSPSLPAVPLKCGRQTVC